MHHSLPMPFPFFMESTLNIFFPDGVFVHCDHGLYFNIGLLCKNSIKLNKIICTITRLSDSERTQMHATGRWISLSSGELHSSSSDLICHMLSDMNL